MADKPADEFERFRPTNGRVLGALGLGLCVVVAVAFCVYEPVGAAVPGVIGCAIAAVVVWLAMLRPSVAASETQLRLRTLLETVSIPLASVDTVVVRRYLLVRAGGTKYICPAIGRSLRKTVRTEMKWKGSTQMLVPGAQLEDRMGGVQTEVQGHDIDYADFVEQQITALAGEDRARRGIEPRSEEEYALGSQVTRRTAWLEVVALAVLGVAFLVSLFV